MKKLFIISIFLCIMFFPKNTFALDYQVNGTTYQVSDIETLRDYVYYTYVNGTNKGVFLVAYSSTETSYYVLIPPENTSFLKKLDNYSRYRFYHNNPDSPTGITVTSSQQLKFDNNFNLISNVDTTSYTPSSGGLAISTAFYPEIINEDNTIYKNANYTFEDITNKYIVEEPEEEEVSNMFECSIELIMQFINYIPVLLTLYVVFDIIGDILPLRRK